MATKARSSKASLESSLRNLSISSTSANSPPKPAPADSWEAEASSSSSSSASTTPSAPATPTEANATPGPPPPTPSSPSHSRKKSTDWARLPSSSNDFRNSSAISQLVREERRPDKSSAAAGRMISGALGIKPPKKSEEGKAYEKAIREKERKRRERVKVEEEKTVKEREEARRAVWDD